MRPVVVIRRRWITGTIDDRRNHELLLLPARVEASSGVSVGWADVHWVHGESVAAEAAA